MFDSVQSLDQLFHSECFIAVDDDRGNKRLVELELACKADGVAPPDPV